MSQQSKCKQSKAEANNAQNTLQREITTLRDAHRTLQLKLRDIEVANDDYERQARNTSSSLEDLESKYNVAIERGVMLEEEMRLADKERETLRIETQRLRDELSDLRVEAEITREKLRTAESTIERLHTRKPLYLSRASVVPRSPASDISRTASSSSPTVSTPPPSKSQASIRSEVPTPPSPPLSDASVTHKAPIKIQPQTQPETILPPKRHSVIPDFNITPKPTVAATAKARHARATSSFVSSTTTATATTKGRMPPPSRPSHMSSSEGLPRSSSLYQIKGLIGRMQKIEERVHSVRSKLPPPSNSTPKASPRLSTASRGSPRLSSALGNNVPASVTMRNSTRKRVPSSTVSSIKRDGDSPASRSSASYIKRLSFGVPHGVPGDQSATPSRPSSRPSSSGQSAPFAAARPTSRSGATTTARTPSALGFHSSQSHAPARPPSSLGSTQNGVQRRGHGYSTSISSSRNSDDALVTPSTGRRSTLDKSSIPTPSTTKRQSGGFSSSVYGRRPSIVKQQQPEEVTRHSPDALRKLSDVGETF